jgi:transglutaminase-like putative cysteine protease
MGARCFNEVVVATPLSRWAGRCRALVAGVLLGSFGAWAQAGDQAAGRAGGAGRPVAAVDEPSRRHVQYHEHHRLEMDGRAVSTYRAATKVLAQNAVEQVRQTTLTVSRSAQRLQVLEAYTHKANGKRVPVPTSSWQVRKDTGHAGQPPIFSDYDATTLVYPEVAVGDTLVLAYRITTREPMFPGKVSMANSFSRSDAFDDVKVVVDAPEAMRLKTQVFDMVAREGVERGRRISTWTWRNPVPQPSTRLDWSVVDVDKQPGYLLSSFDNWDDVARSYVQRATPKAALTPALRELSNSVVAGHTGPRSQAKLLFDWVASQVGYAGNCVGIGAVVPRDLSVVLQHRLGDCKDHATLLQALLAAQGIESHQVLVNAGNLYRLPEVPVASLVNHVLNYIPSLGLFVDATDPHSAFGRLPMMLYGKPVLADAAQVPRRIPNDTGGHAQTMKTVLEIEEDGSVKGRVEVQMSGHYALSARALFRRMEAAQRRDFVKDMYRRFNLQGEGEVQTDDPTPLSDQFKLTGTFRVTRAIGFPGTGGLSISPWFYNEAPALRWAQQAVLPVEDVESVCSSGHSVETYEITLPASMRVVALPDAVAINTALLGYEASYAQDGRQLTVRREVTDRTPPGLCSAEVSRAFRDASQVVLKDLRQQLLFR